MFRNLEGDEHHDFELENVDSNLVLPWSGFISGLRQAAQKLKTTNFWHFDVDQVVVLLMFWQSAKCSSLGRAGQLSVDPPRTISELLIFTPNLTFL